MELGSSSTQLISTAFVFGLSALAFAYLPFFFTLANGLVKANSGHNARSGSIMSVFSVAFIVHFLSCIFFMLGVKLLDVLGALYQNNYLQEKIFPIFWARGKNSVFSLAGSNGGVEDEGAFLQLYIVQTTADWLMLLGIIIVFLTACAYAVIETKKDSMQFNYVSFFVWLLIANVAGLIIYSVWANIASLAVFIPNGASLFDKIVETYQNLLGAENAGNSNGGNKI